LGVDWSGLHKGFFVAWFAVMTLHVLARILPAYRITQSSVGRTTPVPGGWARALLLVAVVASAAALAVALVHAGTGWVGLHRSAACGSQFPSRRASRSRRPVSRQCRCSPRVLR